MITAGVFLLLIGLALFLSRKKVGWGSFGLGVFVALLLLSTPLGGPMHDAVDAIAGALRQAGNGLLDAIRGAVG